MLTLTGEYALRGLIYMAQHGADRPITGNEIAARTGIPPKYLSKILGSLVRAGVLESTRGIGGGFQMTRPPKRISLFEVLAPFEQFQRRRCPFGNQLCSEDDPCQAHDRWKRVIDAQLRFLNNTSVHDVAVKRYQKPRRRLRKSRRA